MRYTANCIVTYFLPNMNLVKFVCVVIMSFLDNQIYAAWYLITELYCVFDHLYSPER